MPSSIANTSTAVAAEKPVLWDVLWRSAGLQAVGLFIVADVLRGDQPRMGALAADVIGIHSGNQTYVLIAAALTGLGALNLMWFAAAVRVILAQAGKDGWGAAVTASSAAFGALLLMVTSLSTTIALAHPDSSSLLSGFNDLSWSTMVLIAFPRAMLIMSIAFGLWRAQIISNRLFALGVLFVILGVLGGTTWMGSGYWAPDGSFTRFVSPSLLLVWIAIVSWVLFSRRLVARTGW